MRAVQRRGDGRTDGPCFQSIATLVVGQILVIHEQLGSLLNLVVHRDRHSLPRSVLYNHKETRRSGQVRTAWYSTAIAS